MSTVPLKFSPKWCPQATPGSDPPKIIGEKWPLLGGSSHDGDVREKTTPEN